MTKTPEIIYHYRGPTERGSPRSGRPSYRWVEGYSENINGNPTAPWMTRRECQQDARKRGAKAQFVRA